GVAVLQRRDDFAPLRRARLNDRPGFTALANPVAGVERQAAFNLLGFRGVALVTALYQHRANLLLEERELFLRGFVGVPAALRGLRLCQRRQHEDHHTGEESERGSGTVHHGNSTPKSLISASAAERPFQLNPKLSARYALSSIFPRRRGECRVNPRFG